MRLVEIMEVNLVIPVFQGKAYFQGIYYNLCSCDSIVVLMLHYFICIIFE